MVEQRLSLKKSFEQDVIQALEEGDYFIEDYQVESDFCEIEAEAMGRIKTKNHGNVEFTFKTTKIRGGY